MKKSTVKTIVVMIFISVVLVGGYYLISTKESTQETNSVKTTEIEKILEKDLSNEYPVTVREVIKLYSRISKCLYNEELTDGEINQLVNQLRMLLDDELLEKNPLDEHLMNLKVEINSYKEKERTINDYLIDQSSAVRYYKQDGDNYATIDVVYTMNEKSGKSESKERFVLREDQNGNWKICGWKLEESVDIDTN